MVKVREQLYDFIKARVRDRILAQRSLQLLEPLVTYGENGSYPLKPSASLDTSAVARAIARAGRTVANQVRVIPSRSGFAEEESHLRAEQAYVMHLPLIFWKNRKEELDRSLPEDLRKELDDLVSSCLVDRLLYALQQSHDSFIGQLDLPLMAAVWTTPLIAAYYLLAYAAIGDRRSFGELVPLMEILPRAIPIGEPWKELETWLVLAA